MLTDDVTECPHCGDTKAGYEYILTMKFKQLRGWGNGEEHNECDPLPHGSHHGACRCAKCKKIVRPREA